jgi:zinc-finger of transposase IS204/IS1001/IS1096/IS1165
MNLIGHLLPNQTDLHLQSWSFNPAHQHAILNLSSTQVVAHCPLCNCPSHRIHSRYERTLKDLPIVQFSLTIMLAVCKFSALVTCVLGGFLQNVYRQWLHLGLDARRVIPILSKPLD